VEGKLVRAEAIVTVLETLLRSGDRVVLEGDNQKQADFLSRSLAQLDPARVHDLHLLIPSMASPDASTSASPARRAYVSRSCWSRASS
jgi:malonate decarboxylase alpha subunit